MRWVAQDGVRVGASAIAGAGQGVFAATALPSNRRLGWYRGAALTEREFDAEYGETRAEYVLQLARNLYVDASDRSTANFVSMVNDARRSGLQANVAFTHQGALRTLRSIGAGEELLVDYGGSYW